MRLGHLRIMTRNTTPIRLTQSDEELRSAFTALRSRSGIARLLQVSDQELIFLLYRGGRKYIEFNVPKRSGGIRHIAAPTSSIKILQIRLNQVFQAVYLPKAPVHGFARNRSILTNARNHLRKRLVLNIDLSDFFPSIHFGRVRGVFANAPYNLPLSVAQILAQLCCHHKVLPQGAPTSPIISNMVCTSLDSSLRQLAQRCQCTYTRYADDITFSTTRRAFPESIAVITNGADGTRNIRIGDELRGAIESNSFRINFSKVRIRNTGERREVTGLVVHNWANVPRKYVRDLRGMLHAWERYGYEAAEAELRARHYRKHRRPGAPPVKLLAVVSGKLEFLRMIRGARDPLYARLWNRFAKMVGEGLRMRVGIVRSPDQIEAALWVLEWDDGTGTAFALDGFGLVTCNHCIPSDQHIEAYQPSNPSKRYSVEVTHRSEEIDLARFQIAETITAGLLPGGGIRTGEFLLVAGYGNYAPGATARVLNGYVTGTGIRSGIDVFYCDHRAFAGNSGGPVLNSNCEVVGILQRAAGSDTPAQETTIIPVRFLDGVPALSRIAEAGA